MSNAYENKNNLPGGAGPERPQSVSPQAHVDPSLVANAAAAEVPVSENQNKPSSQNGSRPSGSQGGAANVPAYESNSSNK